MQDMSELEYRASHPGSVRMYDMQLDTYRDVTQRDVDLLHRAATNWGGTKKAVEDLAGAVAGMHDRYMAHVREISANAGQD